MSTTMRLVILESPYGSPDPRIVERNVIYARRALHDCLRRGEAPIASHLLFTQPGVLDDNIPEERDQGIAAGLAWIRVANGMVVYIDYEISKGMAAAIEEAENADCIVSYRVIGENP